MDQVSIHMQYSYAIFICNMFWMFMSRELKFGCVLGSRALQAFINAKDEEICRNDLDKAALVQTIQANAGLIQSLNAQMDIKEHTINAQKDLLACTNKKMDAMQAVIDALKKVVIDEPKRAVFDKKVVLDALKKVVIDEPKRDVFDEPKKDIDEPKKAIDYGDKK